MKFCRYFSYTVNQFDFYGLTTLNLAVSLYNFLIRINVFRSFRFHVVVLDILDIEQFQVERIVLHLKVHIHEGKHCKSMKVISNAHVGAP